MTYAENTTVPAEKSRAEIERTLTRYGADQFMYGWDGNRAVIRFRAKDRFVQFVIDMPARDDARFNIYLRGQTRYQRTPEQAEKLWEQATRQRWRALALVVKAKLEAVESGIATFENEFLANIMLPDGSTFGDWAGPEIAQVYANGRMPQALLALPSAAGDGA